MKGPLLTLSMIVKDEAETIGRTLSSAAVLAPSLIRSRLHHAARR
jgi:hypothetical protein